MRMESNRRSLKVNMVLNAVKGLMSVLFPLITFPYVSRVLGVENIGKYNFSMSINNYMMLIAGLGISAYGIREGARFREQKDRFPQFASELFSINVLSTLAAYAVLALLLLCVPKFQEYRDLLLIFSLQIAFTTLGTEWIYSVFEDYLYITIRSIAFQLLSLVLLFLFVRDRQDVAAYAAITVISSVGASLINHLKVKKYCRVCLTRHISWRQHLKPILMLFAMSITTTIYINSDTTILGFLCGDYEVGIYAVSTKVYFVVRSLLSSVLVVSIPRLSAILGKGDQQAFADTASDIYRTLITVLLPAMIGMIALRREIVLLISDSSYLAAVTPLTILSVALIFCLGAWFWGQCILVPCQKEGILFRATVTSALLNMVLNFLLIPVWQESAAALTTAISEGVVFVWCAWEGKHIVKLRGIPETAAKTALGCACILGAVWAVRQLALPTMWCTILAVCASVAVYFAVELLVKNPAVSEVARSISSQIRLRAKKK